jgi:hypothetical protein
MTKRIDSLRKKQQMTNKIFKQKGIDPILSEIKLTVKSEDSGIEQYKKFVSAIKRKLTPQYLSVANDEKFKFLQEVSFGYQKVQVSIIDSKESGFNDYLVRLLREMSELRSKSLNEIEEEYVPVKVTVTKGAQESITAYSLLNTKFKKKVHNRSWKLKYAKLDFQPIVDLTEVLAETVAINTLEKFTRENEDLVKYLTVKTISEMSSLPDCTYLPMDPSFSEEIRLQMEKMDLLKENVKLYDFLDNYQDVYYLTKDAKGFVEQIYHHHFKNLVMPEFLSQMNYARESAKEQIAQHEGYAKSFETKKHINKRTLEVMNRNAFLQYYGYVELDNQVDLNLFKAIERDFIDFTKKVFVPNSKDHSFRIKKLGHHKAAGVYFPGFKATILDVDHPDSFAHELGHQMDYTLREDGKMISEQTNFRSLIDLYKVTTQKQIDELSNGSRFKEDWNSNKKYNKNYYFKPTEVFARSYELYLHNKGVQSSFLKGSYERPEYPSDDLYIKRITKFFDELFDGMKDKEIPNNVSLEEELVQKVHDSKKYEPIPTKQEKYEQLSLL